MDAIECTIAEEWDKPQDYERQHVAREWLRRVELPQVEDLLTRELAISQDIYGGDGLGGTRPLRQHGRNASYNRLIVTRYKSMCYRHITSRPVSGIRNEK